MQNHKNEIDDKMIDKLKLFVTDYNSSSSSYNYQISDDVKIYIDSKQFNDDLINNIMLWMKLGIQYPKDYPDSISCMCVGYVYPFINYWIFPNSDYQKTVIDTDKLLEI